jgi:hypothetical protein
MGKVLVDDYGYVSSYIWSIVVYLEHFDYVRSVDPQLFDGDSGALNFAFTNIPIGPLHVAVYAIMFEIL